MSNLIPNNVTSATGLTALAAWTSGTFKVALCTSSYSPLATNGFADSITNELSGGSYARQTLSGKSATIDAANSRTDYSANNAAFAALQMSVAGVPKYAVVLKDNGGAASANEIIAILDLGTIGSADGDFSIKFNNGSSSGVVLRVSRAAGS